VPSAEPSDNPAKKDYQTACFHPECAVTIIPVALCLIRMYTVLHRHNSFGDRSPAAAGARQ